MEGLNIHVIHALRSRFGAEVRKTAENTLMIVFPELPEGRGVSIATIIEHLATEIYTTYLRDIPVGSIVWILHHPPGRANPVSLGEAYEQALLQWDGHHFYAPKWVALPEDTWRLYGLVG
jgi:hypothetical protein